VKPRATFHWYALDWRSRRSAGFDMKPVSTRIAGTFDQLKPVRSPRRERPRSLAPVAATVECWTSLASLARETSRVRLGQIVTCALYRNPGLLAQMAATLEVCSAPGCRAPRAGRYGTWTTNE